MSSTPDGRTLTATMLLLAFSSPELAAPWQPIGPWYGPANVLAYAALGTVAYAGTDAGVYRTPDDGLSWQPRSEGLSAARVTALAPSLADPDLVIAGTMESSLHRSTDGELSWAPAAYAYELVAIGRRGGRELGATLSVRVPAHSFALHAPYPQPLALAASIPFDLPRAAHVDLRIAGAGGRVVRSLLARDLGPGRHVVTWDGMTASGDPVPAGVYLVVLESRGKLRREKIVIAR